jgi:hypothetical protein
MRGHLSRSLARIATILIVAMAVGVVLVVRLDARRVVKVRSSAADAATTESSTTLEQTPPGALGYDQPANIGNLAVSPGSAASAAGQASPSQFLSNTSQVIGYSAAQALLGRQLEHLSSAAGANYGRVVVTANLDLTTGALPLDSSSDTVNVIYLQPNQLLSESEGALLSGGALIISIWQGPASSEPAWMSTAESQDISAGQILPVNVSGALGTVQQATPSEAVVGITRVDSNGNPEVIRVEADIAPNTLLQLARTLTEGTIATAMS